MVEANENVGPSHRHVKKYGVIKHIYVVIQF